MSNSKGSRASRKVPRKPNKPYPEFPLYPHPLGYWSKKVGGTIRHFGRWGRVVNKVVIPVEDQEAAWKEALRLYESRLSDVKLGDVGPGPVVVEKAKPTDVYTVAGLCNDFRNAKDRQKDAGELSARMHAEYAVMCDMLVAQFGRERRVDGLQPDDFAALRERMVTKGVRGEGWGPHRVLNGIVRIKSIFKFAYEAGKIDRLPRYGQQFKPPSAGVMRRHKAKAGVKMFEADELRLLLDGKTVEGEGGPQVVKADTILRAMILLGVNCGFGNDDCAGLSFSNVNLEAGWVEYPRAKTGIERKCPLWPETVAAIRAAIDARPKPAGLEDCGLVFLTYRGTRFVRMGDKSRTDYVSIHFNKLLKALGIAKPGCGFYTLRHVFRTVADGARDIPAVRAIMGHVDASIDAAYRERIEDERLRAVADHVRKWLWPNVSEMS